MEQRQKDGKNRLLNFGNSNVNILLLSAILSTATTLSAQAKNLIIYFSQSENYTADQLVDGVLGESKLIKALKIMTSRLFIIASQSLSIKIICYAYGAK